MKQKNLTTLLMLMANYVKWQDDAEDIKVFVQHVFDYSVTSLSEDEKSGIYWETVHALNCGSNEAQEAAFYARLRALCSGDDELIEKIEELNNII